jgi:hypothetical protein
MPSQYQRITRLEMYWKVSANPPRSSAFFSPWFGMDPADNLNLIQPVNPWMGSAPWQMYTEYFQWRPQHNSNSNSENVNAGQTLHGSLVYVASGDKYILTQTVVETGRSSSQTVACQTGKKFVVPYVVYEKTWPCRNYPPDGKVTFYNITAECDNQDCSKSLNWQAKVKDPNCGMKAVIAGDGTISLTWNTALASKYDNYTAEELYDLNMKGWATKLKIPRPSEIA